MEVVVRGKNVEVTDALRSYATKKLSKLGRFFEPTASHATAVLSVEKERQIVEVTMPMEGGRLLRGEEATPDMYASVDLVVDKLEKQLDKYKARNRHRVIAAVESKPLNETPYDIVKRKTFPVKPMSLEEALLQMDLLGHNFFAFANAETAAINVLYRRKDGNYGLLEPR